VLASLPGKSSRPLAEKSVSTIWQKLGRWGR
jgi:hypothetical protein